jgi:predicted Zn-dependent protease
MKTIGDLESRFNRAREVLLGELTSGEELSMEFLGERSAFMRFSSAKVRQIGDVDESYASFRLFNGERSVNAAFPVSGDVDEDASRAAMALSQARESVSILPGNPYRKPSRSTTTSRQVFPAVSLPPIESLPDAILGPADGLDFVGIHAQGPSARASANSAGACHYFETEGFLTDWSLWLPNGKAVKSHNAGRDFSPESHASRIERERGRLQVLARPERRLEPGDYRAYIAPEALAEVIPFFSWCGLSERDLREGDSAFIALKEGRKSLSPSLSLYQDFGLGLEPRFNEAGELAPERMPLIEGGRLVGSLVSERSASQYGVPSNAAPDGEYLRSPALSPGLMPEAEALAALGTGVYVSNFHYLNWSDVAAARVTGMTRFACFWVDMGSIVAPIKDMRFDESLYSLLGDGLEALTIEQSLIPNTESYGLRAVGGSLLPGILVSALSFKL